MLLIYKDERRWGEMCDQEIAAIRRQTAEFDDGLRRRGVFQAGDPLHPVSTATTVRMKNGKTVLTDGPFAETTEQLGGYNVVEAADLDEVIALAARNPLVRLAGHSIEIRPIRDTGRPST
jgi:hypothetical protein